MLAKKHNKWWKEKQFQNRVKIKDFKNQNSKYTKQLRTMCIYFDGQMDIYI